MPPNFNHINREVHLNLIVGFSLVSELRHNAAAMTSDDFLFSAIFLIFSTAISQR